MIKKYTEQIFLSIVGLLLMLFMLNSCATSQTAQAPVTVTDLVCNMKIEKAEAYTFKYKDKKYYFCSYNCKTTFKMNPEKILTNNCAVK